MALADWFSSFCRNIEVKNGDSISRRYNAITKRLNTDFRDSSSDTANSFYAGSYGRNTAIQCAMRSAKLGWTPLVSYRSHLKEWIAPLRLQVMMIGVLCALGLLIASLGLYALLAYYVASRRQELGIRKAVGAPDGGLMRGVLASGMAMALFGTLIGLGAWYQLLPWTRELVEGIDDVGFLVPLSVTLVVGGSCVIATLVPAIRAMRVDPVVALKAE